MVLAKRAFQLFEARYGWYNPIRSVTIQAINLIPQDTPRQIGLFMDVEKQEKLERLEKCIETIRRRFGKDSIRNGATTKIEPCQQKVLKIRHFRRWRGFAPTSSAASGAYASTPPLLRHKTHEK